MCLSKAILPLILRRRQHLDLYYNQTNCFLRDTKDLIYFGNLCSNPFIPSHVLSESKVAHIFLTVFVRKCALTSDSLSTYLRKAHSGWLPGHDMVDEMNWGRFGIEEWIFNESMSSRLQIRILVFDRIQFSKYGRIRIRNRF